MLFFLNRYPGGTGFKNAKIWFAKSGVIMGKYGCGTK